MRKFTTKTLCVRVSAEPCHCLSMRVSGAFVQVAKRSRAKRCLSAISLNPQFRGDDYIFMRRALDLAAMCTESSDVPVGALIKIDSSSRIIGEGYNRREADQKPAHHAEMIAIDMAAASLGTWRLNSAGPVTLYVTVEPCLMCYGAAGLARIDRIVYGAPNTKFGAVSLGCPLENATVYTPQMLGGILSGPCEQVMKEFFQDRRRPRGHQNFQHPHSNAKR